MQGTLFHATQPAYSRRFAHSTIYRAATRIRNDDQKFRIGFEGAALTQDTLIRITSDWRGPHGELLPGDLPGYTGRLAKVIGHNRLGETQDSNGVAFFPIQPGKRQQVLKFKGDILGTEHFYVHVNAAPQGEPADFSTDRDRSGILKYRPGRYVPVKVALPDIDATREAQNQDRHAKGIYQWVHRPEMQFSAYELTTQSLDIDLNGTRQTLELNYLIGNPAFDPLERYQPGQQLVFDLGGYAVTATVGDDGRLYFDNIDWLHTIDISELISLQLYLDTDQSNILWELALDALIAITSDNPDSAAKNSFIYYPCYDQTAACLARENHAPPIELTLLRTLADTDTLQWEIEALEGNGITDDLASNDCNNGGSNPTCKKIAYNKIKHIQLTASGGNLPAHADTGTGRFEDAWRSAVITGGKLDETDARSIRFRPDPYPHYPATYMGDVKTIRGTHRKDIYRRNPQLGYKITAIVNRGTPLQKTYEKIVRMDDKDLLRQEYINHNQSAGTQIRVPDRNEIIDKTDLPQVGEWGSANDTEPYAYGNWVVNNGMVELWTGISTGFDAWRSENDTYRNHTLLNNAIRLTSAYRNPERNERVGGSSTSPHMRGRASDVAFANLLNQVYLDRGIVFGALWDWTEDSHVTGVPTATFWQLENRESVAIIKSNQSTNHKNQILDIDDGANGVPDVFEESYHLHIQR